MNLSNLFEVIVNYFLIGWMIGLDHRNEFFMMSVLVCTVIYRIRPTESDDIRLLSAMTLPNYYTI